MKTSVAAVLAVAVLALPVSVAAQGRGAGSAPRGGGATGGDAGFVGRAGGGTSGLAVVGPGLPGGSVVVGPGSVVVVSPGQGTAGGVSVGNVPVGADVTTGGVPPAAGSAAGSGLQTLVPPSLPTTPPGLGGGGTVPSVTPGTGSDSTAASQPTFVVPGVNTSGGVVGPVLVAPGTADGAPSASIPGMAAAVPTPRSEPKMIVAQPPEGAPEQAQARDAEHGLGGAIVETMMLAEVVDGSSTPGCVELRTLDGRRAALALPGHDLPARVEVGERLLVEVRREFGGEAPSASPSSADDGTPSRREPGPAADGRVIVVRSVADDAVVARVQPPRQATGADDALRRLLHPGCTAAGAPGR